MQNISLLYSRDILQCAKSMAKNTGTRSAGNELESEILIEQLQQVTRQ